MAEPELIDFKTNSLQPLVSIIITAFNQEKFIAEAVQSVINQSYENWECIIVDDGSTDNTRNICNEFVQKDSRIIYTYQPNQGVSAARNNGFALTKGSFVQFLDGDDYLNTEKLKIQIEFLVANPDVTVCYTDHLFFIQHENRFVRHQFKLLSGNPLHEILFDYDNGVSIPIHSALISKTVFDNEQLPFTTEYQYRYEDWVFWVRIVLNNARFHFINQPLCVYRMHKENFCADDAETTFHALRAVNYIGKILDSSLDKKFIDERSAFFLKRMQSRVIDSLSAKKLLVLLFNRKLDAMKRLKSEMASVFNSKK